MTDNQKVFDALNDIEALREHIRVVTRVKQTHTINTTDSESKLAYSNVITTLTDCIEMYLARLEVATENAWNGYRGGKATA